MFWAVGSTQTFSCNTSNGLFTLHGTGTGTRKGTGTIGNNGFLSLSPSLTSVNISA